MISDDAPDPRNGKIIQCRVLARTLWVPWAGSLAGPWREAPCHYAAGLHHPHQYSIFGAPPQRGSTNPPASQPFFLSFSTRYSLLISSALVSSHLISSNLISFHLILSHLILPHLTASLLSSPLLSTVLLFYAVAIVDATIFPVYAVCVA